MDQSCPQSNKKQPQPINPAHKHKQHTQWINPAIRKTKRHAEWVHPPHKKNKTQWVNPALRETKTHTPWINPAQKNSQHTQWINLDLAESDQSCSEKTVCLMTWMKHQFWVTSHKC
jgi:hypothetical protein